MLKRQREMLERKEKLVTLLLEPEEVTWSKSRLGKRGTVELMKSKLGVNDNTMSRYLNELYADGRAHIGRWHRTAGCPAAVWVKGPGEHAPKPERQDGNVYKRKYRKNKANAIARARDGKPYDKRYAKHVAVAIADDTVARTSVAPVTWLSALGAG